MYSFKNDYSELAHPEVLKALVAHQDMQFTGYGEDVFSEKASVLIQNLIGCPHAHIHFVSGGTQANALAAKAFLKPYEALIAADIGHILVHEAGAIEATGHKVLYAPHHEGKISANQIQEIVNTHVDEHMVVPKMVYLSFSTELGTLYSREEFIEISKVCKQNQLLLYIDGARLGSAMNSVHNDISWADLGNFADVFYIGGTKNGALFGEAMVICNKNLQPYFRFYLKQYGALLAKGASLGIQFHTLFENGLFHKLAHHANHMASHLATELKAKGIEFWMPPVSNQIFPVLYNTLIDKLSQEFGFYIWKKHDDKSSVVRLVCSWATEEKMVNDFLSKIY